MGSDDCPVFFMWTSYSIRIFGANCFGRFQRWPLNLFRMHFVVNRKCARMLRTFWENASSAINFANDIAQRINRNNAVCIAESVVRHTSETRYFLLTNRYVRNFTNFVDIENLCAFNDRVNTVNDSEKNYAAIKL